MSDVAVKGCGDALEVSDVLEADGSDSSSVDSLEPLIPSSLERQILRDYGRRPVEIVICYFRGVLDFSAYANKAAFLGRCRSKRVVPVQYRVECPDIKNTHNIVRILDICSYKLMVADLDYNRIRKGQVSRKLEMLHENLANVLSAQDLHNVLALCKEKYNSVLKATREKQRAMFAELLEEYKINAREQENDK
ncbi:hypothetical protein HPB50_026387 [Hyalomma asiaticum]|uniref:Uncharacterized protein n=1 Tax=Hyalomma asiaticum TaxID=266040 RepID=A0ACB7TUV4_HYAAI|nr:hypothetical protein HPB50_026387 [Hyalomma asiaticum]